MDQCSTTFVTLRMVPATHCCGCGRTVRGMQLPLPADVLVPLGIGAVVVVVAVAALVLGLRRRGDDSPAPTDADWTGENVGAVATPAKPEPAVAVKRTVADAIAARRADTDPFPVIPHASAAVTTSEHERPNRGVKTTTAPARSATSVATLAPTRTPAAERKPARTTRSSASPASAQAPATAQRAASAPSPTTSSPSASDGQGAGEPPPHYRSTAQPPSKPRTRDPVPRPLPSQRAATHDSPLPPSPTRPRVRAGDPLPRPPPPQRTAARARRSAHPLPPPLMRPRMGATVWAPRRARAPRPQ